MVLSFHKSTHKPKKKLEAVDFRESFIANVPHRVQDEFGDLRWVPLRPEFLDYPNAQFLLVGGTHHEATEAAKEVETFEHQDEARISPLNGKS